MPRKRTPFLERLKTDGGLRLGMNEREYAVATRLEREGYTVIKSGWPDFIATRGSEIRFVEVKPYDDVERLPTSQRRVADILKRASGISVEVVSK